MLGLERERIAYLRERLFELDEIISRLNAEMDLANREFIQCEKELKKLIKTQQQ